MSCIKIQTTCYNNNNCDYKLTPPKRVMTSKRRVVERFFTRSKQNVFPCNFSSPRHSLPRIPPFSGYSFCSIVPVLECTTKSQDPSLKITRVNLLRFSYLNKEVVRKCRLLWSRFKISKPVNELQLSAAKMNRQLTFALSNEYKGLNMLTVYSLLRWHELMLAELANSQLTDSDTAKQITHGKRQLT